MPFPSCACSAFVLSIILAASSPIQAQHDWPVFRGNGLQTGVANSTLSDSLTTLWTFKAVDSIEGAPVIAGRTVFVGCWDGSLIALDLANGKKKWTYKSKTIKNSSPAVHDGVVYIGDTGGTLHAVDAASGEKRWTFTTAGEINSSANFAGTKILIGSDDHHLYCLNADGKLAWKCKTKEKVRGAAAVVGDRVLFGGCDQLLHIVDLNTGHDLKTIQLAGHVGASVAVWGDQAYVGSMANRFHALNVKTAEIVWKFEAKRTPQPFFSSAAVTENLVVVGSRDKRVHALQRQTGKEVWLFPTEGRVDSSPVIVGNRVLVGSYDGHLYVLDLARGTELSRFHFGPMAGAPAVADQCVVVATIPGAVHCLGAKTK